MNTNRKKNQIRNCIELLHIMKEHQFKAPTHVQHAEQTPAVERTGEAATPARDTTKQPASHPSIQLMLGNPITQTN